MTASHRSNMRPLFAYRAFLLLGAMCWSFAAGGAEQHATLAKVKTAYIFNIAKFVDWPGGNESVRLCVHPDSVIKAYLAKLHDRPIGNNRLLQVIETREMASSCHIYYSDEPTVPEVRAPDQTVDNSNTGPSSVLAVSDHSSALERGYAIQFHLQQEKLRFRFSKSVLDRASFKVSSKLLRLGSSDS